VRLSEISIERPVLAAMMSLALVLFGLVALQRLPVRELPDIDPPIVNVTTVFPGANAAVVETEVTEKLEEAINSIEGLKELTSESREQVSTINVEFDLSRDIELCAQDVRDRVARVRGTLPEEIEEPIVAKQDADAQPVIWIALFSDRYSTLELTTFAENLMQDRLQTVKGVSSVFLGGRKRFAIRIRLDAEKMAARQVTVQDVDLALKSQNVELPSGRVESRDREMTIQTLGELKTAEEFNRLVIRQEGNAFVRLLDIGRAEVGVEDERSVARFNSQPAVGLGIVKQSKANTIEVARGVKKELDRMLPTLPAGVKTFLPYDESVFVEQSIHEVWITLFIAFVLVMITIFVFLRNVRSTLIPCLTIPVAIVGTYAVLSMMGYSVNILTMLALVLAIGIVVDDSIVVLENIYRHIEEGMSPMDAAKLGMKEIGFAVIAITLTLCAVFIPLAFQTSITGRLFIEFAIALSGSVLISAFVALTLTPMVSARILKPLGEVKHGPVFNFFERGFDHFNHHYERMLRWSLGHRAAVVVGAVALFAATGWIYTRLSKEFLPEEDKGRLIAFALAPEGSTAEYTDRMVRRIEDIIRSTPEVDGYFTAVALARGAPGKGNEGLGFMRLKEDRERSVGDIVGGPHGIGARMFGEVEGALAFPIIPKAISRGFGQSFQLVLKDQDLDQLNRTAQEVANRLRQSGYLLNVRSTYELSKPELRIHIDRNRAAALGISVADISRTLQILFGGLDLSTIKLGGKEYDVIAQLDRESRLTPADLDRLYVRSNSGGLVQLNNVVSYATGAGPSSINHFNRFRAATIEASPMGVPLGTAMERAEALLRSEFPGTMYDWTGEAADLREAGRGFVFVIVLAIIVIYMVLASQFESLLHPLTIMLTLPLAAAGAFGLLWVLNGVNLLGTLLHGWAHYAPDPPAIARWLSAAIPRIPAMNMNLFSQIGMVLLIGLATKNSILLVEFANQQVQKGKSARDAMLQAGLIRFRPILMTSFSTILGILPIAIGFGAGGESRRPMGVAAVGGLLTSTFLTLLLVPVAYTLFADWGARIRRLKVGPAAAAAVGALLLAMAPQGMAASEGSDLPDAADKTYDLERCIATALEDNFDIRQARERLVRQRAVVTEVRARLLPHLGAAGQYQQQDEGLAGNFGGPAAAINEESWIVGLELTQSLFAGGGNVAGLRRETLLEDAALADLESTINHVLLEVRERYYTVLLGRSQIDVQEQNVKLLEEELASEQNKLSAGVVSPFNVLRAEVTLANGQTPLIRARNAYQIALEELSRVLGQSAGAEDVPTIRVVGELAYQDARPDLAQSLETARRLRPELRRFDRTIEAAQQRLREARSGYMPAVSAFGGYTWENDKMSLDTADYVDGWTAGVRASWDIFSSGATRGRTRQAMSDAMLAELERDEGWLAIDLEVRRAYLSLNEARKLVEATRKVVEQAEESVRLARSRFDVGAATQLDVLVTQQQLTQARDNEVQALYDYNIVLARLRNATGEAVQFVATEAARAIPREEQK
jgi:hydrophobe/amphiphile efflux-1 (HAE1) family protein